jgi:hypothetical protein
MLCLYNGRGGDLAFCNRILTWGGEAGMNLQGKQCSRSGGIQSTKYWIFCGRKLVKEDFCVDYRDVARRTRSILEIK